MTERKEIAGSGHRKTRAREALDVHSSTMTKTDEREKEMNDSERRVRQNAQSSPKPESATRQEHLQDETIGLHVTATRKGVA